MCAVFDIIGTGIKSFGKYHLFYLTIYLTKNILNFIWHRIKLKHQICANSLTNIRKQKTSCTWQNSTEVGRQPIQHPDIKPSSGGQVHTQTHALTLTWLCSRWHTYPHTVVSLWSSHWRQVFAYRQKSFPWLKNTGKWFVCLYITVMWLKF